MVESAIHCSQDDFDCLVKAIFSKNVTKLSIPLKLGKAKEHDSYEQTNGDALLECLQCSQTLRKVKIMVDDQSLNRFKLFSNNPHVIIWDYRLEKKYDHKGQAKSYCLESFVSQIIHKNALVY